MSTQSEKIRAQAMAFNENPTRPWHRHIIGPAELEALLEAQKRMRVWQQASFATTDSMDRSLFEQWISGSPYERDIHRWPQDETKYAWPGHYKDIAVQLAWEAWCEATLTKMSHEAP